MFGRMRGQEVKIGKTSCSQMKHHQSNHNHEKNDLSCIRNVDDESPKIKLKTGNTASQWKK
jgi:hypothetical protein